MVKALAGVTDLDAVEGGELLAVDVAALALGEMREEAKDAVPALAVSIGDSDWMVRNSSAYALYLIGTPEAVAVLNKNLPLFIMALQSGTIEDSLSAAEGIGYFGKYGDGAVPALAQTLDISVAKAKELEKTDPERAKYYLWIGNAAAASLQKIRPIPR